MSHAWIDGKAVPLDAAANEAARLLSASRLPVIAGLGTDIAGARAAIARARQLSGVIDHMHSDLLLRDLAASGMVLTTPNEARLRADTVLVQYLYMMAFQQNKSGYGSAIALGLFVIVMVISVLQYQLLRARGDR